MTTSNDPFEAVSDEPIDQTILSGAALLAASTHPVYGSTYRCRGYRIVYPWLLRVGYRATAYRGDTYDAPQLGTATVTHIRVDGAYRNDLTVGTTQSGEIRFDVVLDQEIPAQVGDTFTFDAPEPSSR